MSLVVQLGKPVGIIAAILSIVQGIIWIVLTILGLLTYTCTIDMETHVTNPTTNTLFLTGLSLLYFVDDLCLSTVLVFRPNYLLTPYDVHILVSINLAFNVIWVAASVYYLVELCKNNGKGFGVYGWIATASAVLMLDLANAIVFGLEYDKMVMNANASPSVSDVVAYLVPMFLVTLSMRGFILWLVNDAFIAFIIYHLVQKKKEQANGASRNLSRQASFINPTMNTAYPDSTDNDSNYPKNNQQNYWDPTSPTDNYTYPYSQTPTPTGNAQRPPGMYNEQPQRTPGGYNYMAQDQPPQRPLVLAEPPKGRPTSNGQFGAPPKHIPSPDYSPPMNHKEVLPLRPVLRKPPGKIGQIGRTVF